MISTSYFHIFFERPRCFAGVVESNDDVELERGVDKDHVGEVV